MLLVSHIVVPVSILLGVAAVILVVPPLFCVGAISPLIAVIIGLWSLLIAVLLICSWLSGSSAHLPWTPGVVHHVALAHLHALHVLLLIAASSVLLLVVVRPLLHAVVVVIVHVFVASPSSRVVASHVTTLGVPLLVVAALVVASPVVISLVVVVVIVVVAMIRVEVAFPCHVFTPASSSAKVSALSGAASIVVLIVALVIAVVVAVVAIVVVVILEALFPPSLIVCACLAGPSPSDYLVKFVVGPLLLQICLTHLALSTSTSLLGYVLLLG